MSNATHPTTDLAQTSDEAAPAPANDNTQHQHGECLEPINQARQRLHAEATEIAERLHLDPAWFLRPLEGLEHVQCVSCDAKKRGDEALALAEVAAERLKRAAAWADESDDSPTRPWKVVEIKLDRNADISGLAAEAAEYGTTRFDWTTVNGRERTRTLRAWFPVRGYTEGMSESEEMRADEENDLARKYAVAVGDKHGLKATLHTTWELT
jgi:hypothetical protein